MRYRVHDQFTVKTIKGEDYLLVENDVITVIAIDKDLVVAKYNGIAINFHRKEMDNIKEIPKRVNNN